ncbi:Hypothetical predicted protein [Cloeon dipterum]|uniref:Uncharacterized protein n=1 Tax=Cloeon dipterum TaxID=197152 RepID=A0A8S1C5V5_9INSE|nr:Hypothetical predicted protein [Cloeon dipterum]
MQTSQKIKWKLKIVDSGCVRFKLKLSHLPDYMVCLVFLGKSSTAEQESFKRRFDGTAGATCDYVESTRSCFNEEFPY